VVAAQNILSRKLDLSREGQLEAADFEKYIKLFNNGLMEDQAHLVLELIKCSKVMTSELPETE
jgi:hypothetical protein